MAIKYLYLDDAAPNEIMPFIQAVERSNKIEIVLEHPLSYNNNNFDALLNTLKQYNGVILDWRLDEMVGSDLTKRYPFRAGALAQELRSRASEGVIDPIPIVLWSATQKFKNAFQSDYTAQDLFDRKYIKEEVAEDGEKVALELEALVNGYTAIKVHHQKGQNISVILGCQEHPEYLDLRVKERFTTGIHSVHELADFILNQLIERPGLLISEELLSARLGLDRVASQGWENLKQNLDGFFYKGPFSSAWPRWWRHGVEEQWWFSNVKAEIPLSALTASERIQIISAYTKIENLVPASPASLQYHDKFYTICEETRIPLDPIDGVIIDEPQPEPWQERRYISLDVALKHRSEHYHPHSIEKERLKAIAENSETKG